MARIKRRSKRNPESNMTPILVIGGVAIAGYFAYTNGWFNSLLGTAITVAPATGTTAGVLNQSGQVSPTAAAAVSVPPLGKIVSTNADLALQVGAKLPYILPASSILGQQPAGYVLAKDATVSETGTSDGSMYLRLDVANALVSLINAIGAMSNVGAQAAGQPAVFAPISNSTLYQTPFSNLAQVQSVMQNAGLSGMGFVRARSMFPYNPITTTGWN